MKFILICFLLLPSLSFADCNNLTEGQLANLKLAYQYGEQITFRGDTFGETVASILWQESKAGCDLYKTKGFIVGDLTSKGKPKSLGIMQVQLRSARDVERWYPEVFEKHFGKESPSDEDLILRLLLITEFNIEVGCKYYQKMLGSKKDWKKSILAYNRGASNDGRDPNNYVKRVKQWRKKIILKRINYLKG